MRSTNLLCVRILACALGVLFGSAAFAGTELHVAPNGSDANPGTLDKPLATLQRARDLIRQLRKGDQPPQGGVRVILHEGRYFLAEPLVLGPQDSGAEGAPIIYSAEAGKNVVLSGGRLITGWKNVRDNLWTVALPEVQQGKWYFRQLFTGDRRLTRARSPNSGFFLSTGPLSKYAGGLKDHWGGMKAVGGLRATEPDLFCGMNFRAGDIKAAKDLDQAEVLTWHSWECSWQTVRRIDEAQHDVYFNTPCRYPVGFFSPECRYRVENIAEALDEPGEWLLDRKTGVLSYLAAKDENPNTMGIVAPVLQKLLVLDGDGHAGQFVQHVTFSGLSFRHADYPLGIYDVAPGWPAQALKVDPTWPKDFPPGYTDAQAAPNCGQVIEFNSARHCTLERCEVTLIGNYALAIQNASRANRVAGCFLHDLGGGGIRVGPPTRTVKNLDKDDTPSDNLIEDNTIRHTSLVHPSAVGIMIAQSQANRVRHNEIADIGYAGIHIGWTWGRDPNYTSDNLLEANHIFGAMRDLADAGGIYSLGIQAGTVFRENYIHDIVSPRGAIGAPVNGMFFDEGTRDLRVERNVIRNCLQPIRFNQCKYDEQTFVENSLGLSLLRGKPAGKMVAGKDGNGCLFSDGGQVVGHWPDLETDFFTLCAWIKLDALPQGAESRQWIAGKNADEWSDAHYSLLVQGDKPAAYVNLGGGKENRFSLTGKQPLVAGQWHHVAMTLGRTTIGLFLDGQPAGEMKLQSSRKKGTGDLVIGGRPDGWKPGNFHGIIDDVRFYRRNLNAAQLKAIISAPAQLDWDTGLVHAWTFDSESPAFNADPVIQSAGPRSNLRRP
jgi:hypothetical protein